MKFWTKNFIECIPLKNSDLNLEPRYFSHNANELKLLITSFVPGFQRKIYLKQLGYT